MLCVLITLLMESPLRKQRVVYPDIPLLPVPHPLLESLIYTLCIGGDGDTKWKKLKR